MKAAPQFASDPEAAMFGSRADGHCRGGDINVLFCPAWPAGIVSRYFMRREARIDVVSISEALTVLHEAARPKAAPQSTDSN